jgi:hypothetical protein
MANGDITVQQLSGGRFVTVTLPAATLAAGGMLTFDTNGVPQLVDGRTMRRESAGTVCTITTSPETFSIPFATDVKAGITQSSEQNTPPRIGWYRVTAKLSILPTVLSSALTISARIRSSVGPTTRDTSPTTNLVLNQARQLTLDALINFAVSEHCFVDITLTGSASDSVTVQATLSSLTFTPIL